MTGRPRKFANRPKKGFAREECAALRKRRGSIRVIHELCLCPLGVAVTGTVKHPISAKESRALRRLQREALAPSPYVFVSERGAPLSVAGVISG